ncbi:serine/threonine-protein kinase DCLK3 [Betta splendens]|uniref:non-specific serine/threonine protein kinase n=1 Tax=Betta splendens TaxID=158456 RepID=A0A6P7NY21_BETSP|nr:serine/threonine-protein kinase DCLK3 [Betta splendens]
MTHPLRARYGCEERNARSRVAAPPVSLMKLPGGGPQTWPARPRHTGPVCRPHLPAPPQVSLFHTRHAEESAERPHLVTVVRPCGPSSLRKVTVLLNRRGVVSFEQLLLDLSEALGFPRWHRSRVTRLYTTHAREVKGVCDFFRGEAAFLALGKARPELGAVQEALEELFPEHAHYRADALCAWEKKLRPAPDKAAKADSGYSEGTDDGETSPERREEEPAPGTKPANTQTRPRADSQQLEHNHPDVQKPHQKKACRKGVHAPNHLQRLRGRGASGPRPLPVPGPFQRDGDSREEDVVAPPLCESCLARQARQQGAGRMSPLPGRVPLPPVPRKHREPRRPLSPDAERPARLQLLNPDVAPVERRAEPPPRGDAVTAADIERRYDMGRVVGDGNFAVVRECRRRGGGARAFAMKVVERAKLAGREHMMQNELSLLGSLRHPRVVRLFAHHHTHTHFYLLMELVDGGDLFEAISDRGRFPEAEAGLMVSDVSDALSYIHGKSIAHRDVKPENLLLERVAAGVSRLKLGDFGLAMVVTEPVFTICGTPTYVAPEILHEAGYGVAVDVWALGVILYILLCGFPPFRSQARDQEELFELIKEGHLHFLSPYWDPISEEARGLVRALLQPDPTARLTAEQTLLHPWVTAMASVCRQRALTDKTQAEAEPGEVESQAQTPAAETDEDKAPGRASWRESTLRDAKQSEKVTGRGRGEDALQEGSAVRAASPRVEEHTPGPQEPQCDSTDCGSPSRQAMQQPSGPRGASADLSRLHATAQHDQQQPPAGSLSSTSTAATPPSPHSPRLSSAHNHNHRPRLSS